MLSSVDKVYLTRCWLEATNELEECMDKDKLSLWENIWLLRRKAIEDIKYFH